ncbi:MAG: hypothetical protein ACQETE_05465 [Bacteroidota bacterium]
MKSDNQKKREKIYDIYANNFALIENGGIINIKKEIPFRPICFCPTCFRGLSRDLVHPSEKIDLHFTIEDVPPRVYGGNGKIVTCNECNNYAGYNLDVEVGNAIKSINATNSEMDLEFDTTFHFFDRYKVNGIVNLSDVNNIEIEYHEHRSNPNDLEAILRKLKENEGLELKFQFGEWNVEKYHRAMLRIAHLLAFYRFGHAYLFLRSIRTLVEKVMGIKNFEYKHFVLRSGTIENSEDGIYLVIEPNRLRSLLVIFSLDIEGVIFKRGVLLPLAEDNTLKIYRNLERAIEDESIKKLSYVKMPEVNYLSSEKNIREFLNIMKENIIVRRDDDHGVKIFER